MPHIHCAYRSFDACAFAERRLTFQMPERPSERETPAETIMSLANLTGAGVLPAEKARVMTELGKTPGVAEALRNIQNPKASIELRPIGFGADAGVLIVVSHKSKNIGGATITKNSNTVPVLVRKLTEYAGMLNASVAQPQPETNSDRPNIPVGTERLMPDVEAANWMKLNTVLATNSIKERGEPRLVDASTFVSDGFRKEADTYAGKSDAGVTFVKLAKNGYSYGFTVGAETWLVGESVYYKDQFKNGIPFAQSEIVLYAGFDGEERTQILCKVSDLLAGGRVNGAAVKRKMAEARENRKNEDADPAGVQKLDIGSQPIGYIGMIDGPSDVVMQGTIADARNYPRMMNSLKTRDGRNRYNFVTAPGSDQVRVNAEPAKMLDDMIAAMYKDGRGLKRFYLNFVGHGNDEGIHFKGPDGRKYVLTFAKLEGIFSKYRDCEFRVNSVACYGGGMAKGMAAYRDPTGKVGRVIMSLQSKGAGTNQEGRVIGMPGVDGQPKVHSTYYNIFYAHFIQRGYTDGMAHYQADRLAKQMVPCDAEMLVSGPAGSSVTRGMK